MKITRSLSVLLIFGVPMSSVHAQDIANEITDLRQLLGEIQADYDARISDLEERLAVQAEQARLRFGRDGREARLGIQERELAEDIALAELGDRLDPRAAAERRTSLGGSAWSEIERQVALLRER